MLTLFLLSVPLCHVLEDKAQTPCNVSRTGCQGLGFGVLYQNKLFSVVLPAGLLQFDIFLQAPAPSGLGWQRGSLTGARTGQPPAPAATHVSEQHKEKQAQ